MENIMPIQHKDFIYNVFTPDEVYFNNYQNGQVFNEHLHSENTPRDAWSDMLMAIQKQEIDHAKNPDNLALVVFIPSIEALQAKDKQQFDTLIGDVIKHKNCTLFAEKEQAFYNNMFPDGISHDMTSLKAAQKKLEEKWATKEPGIEILSVKKKEQENLGVEILSIKKKEQEGPGIEVLGVKEKASPSFTRAQTIRELRGLSSKTAQSPKKPNGTSQERPLIEIIGKKDKGSISI